MRRLLLLRHAKTETEASSGRDFDRRLDERGMVDAETIGRWLARQAERPMRVLVSTAMRTQQTWLTVAQALPEQPEVFNLDSLYDASLTDLTRAIRAHGADASSLMLVGHNPSLHELGLALMGSADANMPNALDGNLPTCGLVTLDFDADHWDDAGFRRGHLIGVVTPKSLRDAVHPAR